VSALYTEPQNNWSDIAARANYSDEVMQTLNCSLTVHLASVLSQLSKCILESEFTGEWTIFSSSMSVVRVWRVYHEDNTKNESRRRTKYNIEKNEDGREMNEEQKKYKKSGKHDKS